MQVTWAGWQKACICKYIQTKESGRMLTPHPHPCRIYSVISKFTLSHANTYARTHAHTHTHTNTHTRARAHTDSRSRSLQPPPPPSTHTQTCARMKQTHINSRQRTPHEMYIKEDKRTILRRSKPFSLFNVSSASDQDVRVSAQNNVSSDSRLTTTGVNRVSWKRVTRASRPTWYRHELSKSRYRDVMPFWADGYLPDEKFAKRKKGKKRKKRKKKKKEWCVNCPLLPPTPLSPSPPIPRPPPLQPLPTKQLFARPIILVMGRLKFHPLLTLPSAIPAEPPMVNVGKHCYVSTLRGPCWHWNKLTNFFSFLF